MDYPQKKKPKPDEKRPRKPPIPFRTGDFLREEFKRGTVSKTVGKGLLVTEQWLLHPGPGGEAFHVESVAFSAVDKDGKLLDDDMNKSVVKHFQLFHSVLLPSALTGSAKVMSPNEVWKHYMSVEMRVIFLSMLAVATGCVNVEELKQKQNKNNVSAKKSILAIGMATDILVQAVNPNEVGPAVQCMSNIWRHAKDTLIGQPLSNFKVIKTTPAGSKDDAKQFLKACVEDQIDFGPKDLELVMADNVNWKVMHGPKAGTVESWMLMAHQLATEFELSDHYGPNRFQGTRKRLERRYS
jgi:hypothetical protein